MNSLRSKKGTFDTHLCHPPSLAFPLCRPSVFHPPSLSLSLSSFSLSIGDEEWVGESPAQWGTDWGSAAETDIILTRAQVYPSRTLSPSLSVPPTPTCVITKPFLVKEIHWLQKIRSELPASAICVSNLLYIQSLLTRDQVALACSPQPQVWKLSARGLQALSERLLETSDRETESRSRATFANVQAHAHISLSPLPPAGIFLSQVI